MMKRASWAFIGAACLGLCTFTYAPAEVIVFYDFNDASSSDTVPDVSGNGNDAEILDAEFTEPGGGRTGVANDRAMDFLEFNDDVYLTIPSAEDGAFNSIVDSDQVTLTMWILGGDDQPVDQWTFYAGPDRKLGSHIPWSNSNVYFDVAGIAGDACCNDRINTEIDFETFAEEWNHYAFVKNEDMTAIYQNGELLLEGFDMREMEEIDEFVIGAGPEGDRRSYHGLIDDFGVFDTALSEEEIVKIMNEGWATDTDPVLMAGDADQDLDFDQLDLVKVQVAAKYLSGTAATWGDGDWDGAPGGKPGEPPAGDGFFNQLDIISALSTNVYLTGPYAALANGDGKLGDGQTSLVYDTATGELKVDSPAGVDLTSINITSAGSKFIGDQPPVLDGAFDNFAADNVFKATFGGSFGDISFGNVLPPGLSSQDVVADLTAVGSLAGGGDLGDVDLVFIPEPSSLMLILLGVIALQFRARQR